ncbi:MAG: hypothetical protein LWY06_20610 [Firmicutes bacterium]|nr:hypothetical protein [Bacillota bacterium]
MGKVASFAGFLMIMAALIFGFLSLVTVFDPAKPSQQYDYFGRPLTERSLIARIILANDRPSPGFLWELFDTVIFFGLFFAGGKLMAYDPDLSEIKDKKSEPRGSAWG